MTARALVVLGGGDHARVVIEAALSREGAWDILGVVDPRPDANAAIRLGVPELGTDDGFAERLAREPAEGRPWLVVGVGGIDSAARRILADRFTPLASWATVVHATAWISPTAELASGSVALAGSIVNAGARVGAHAVLNSGAIVEHDVTVGDYAHIAPGAVLGGGAIVGAGAFIGLGARVRDHVAIGDGAIVGMGAVVVTDVAPCAKVVGLPARAREGRHG